ncbi:hypothetical protein AAES_55020 [Amazona aestiva]|uniref:Uncharacterized protein n=1 Tax=Amazona aestiva TaxID=12930 RepID=A0A0Q3MMP1_AMAAE|nr:hypothetical protein AAES_55020 [Amazona aestiva]
MMQQQWIYRDNHVGSITRWKIIQLTDSEETNEFPVLEGLDFYWTLNIAPIIVSFEIMLTMNSSELKYTTQVTTDNLKTPKFRVLSAAVKRNLSTRVYGFMYSILMEYDRIGLGRFLENGRSELWSNIDARDTEKYTG